GVPRSLVAVVTLAILSQLVRSALPLFVRLRLRTPVGDGLRLRMTHGAVLLPSSRYPPRATVKASCRFAVSDPLRALDRPRGAGRVSCPPGVDRRPLSAPAGKGTAPWI